MKHFDAGCPKPEIVIGLAGPVGTDLNKLSEEIESSLSKYRYQSHTIKVSSLISEWTNENLKDKILKSKTDDRIQLLMNSGDALRKKYSRGDILVPMIVSYIRTFRRDNLKNLGYDGQDLEDLELYNHCYIINSLKHPDEVRTLREIYKDKFILISAFRDEESRISNLCRLIAKSYNSTDNESFRDKAKNINDIDAERPDTSLGQSLTKTFHRGDFFIRLEENFPGKLERFLDLFFGNPFTTPYRDEFFMFEAKSNSLRSADLSRQVGAVITSSNNDIIARGCNEVPAVNGGAYWSDDPAAWDLRDYKQERDFNEVKKIEILEELVQFLIDEAGLSTEAKPPELQNAEAIVHQLVLGQFKESFRGLRVSNLIEFGRVVHAEMHALMEAARRGLSVQDGNLYCTTYPCHMCARHIIAAGIKRVVYVEPYPKSMTKELYCELVAIDEQPAGDQKTMGPFLPQRKVVFEPFEGIAPSVYKQLFSFKKRKDEQGYVVEWKRRSALPALAGLSTAHLKSEIIHVKSLDEVEILGLSDVP